MSKRGQLLRFLMLVEKRAWSMLLLTVSTRLPIFETTQKIVEIPTVQELVICSGNFLKSRLWSGSTTNSQVMTCGVDGFHVNSNSSCVSGCFPARCTACLVVGVCHTPVSARLLTHPDDSSTSAFFATQNIRTSHQSADSHFNEQLYSSGGPHPRNANA